MKTFTKVARLLSALAMGLGLFLLPASPSGAVTPYQTATTFSSGGSGSQDAVISPDGSTLWEVNVSSNTISRITLATGAVTTIPTGASQNDGLAISPNGQYVWVTLSGGSLIRISVADNSETSVALPSGSNAIAVSPNSAAVWVGNYASNSVSVVNASTMAATTLGAYFFRPRWLTFTPDGSQVWVSNVGLNTYPHYVTEVSATSPYNVINVQTSSRSNHVTMSPDGTTVWSVNYDSAAVTKINTSNDTTTEISVGQNPFTSAISPDGSAFWVLNVSSNTVTKINTTTNQTTTYATGAVVPDVNCDQDSIAVSPDSSTVWVVNNADNSVSSIDVATGTVTVHAVANSPYDVTVDPQGNAWVVSSGTNGGAGSITELSKVVAPSAPSGLSVTGNADGSYSATWQASSGATSYLCTLMTGYNTPTTFALTTSATQCSFTGLGSNAGYGISVVAMNAVGNSPNVTYFAPVTAAVATTTTTPPLQRLVCGSSSRRIVVHAVQAKCPAGYRRL